MGIMCLQINKPMCSTLCLTFLFVACIPFGKAASLKSSKNVNCKKCDSSIIQITSQHVTNLSYDQITNFFCTMDESCINNVEFSEVSNELLFKIFLNEPKLSLKSLNDNTDVSLDFILKRLSEPINDSIDLRKIHSNVSRIKGYNQLKEKILHSLQVAIDKY